MNALLGFAWPVSEVVVERLGWVLVHSLWQFTLVALLTGAVVRALRRNSAAARYAVLVVAMGVSVATPFATWVLQPGDEQFDPASGVTSVRRWDQTSLGSPNESKESADQSNEQRVIEPIDALADRGQGDSSDAWTHRRTDVAPLAGRTIPDSDLDLRSPNPDGASNASLPDTSWSERARIILRPWLAWIVSAWCLGVILCSLRPLLGWRTLWRLQRVGVSPASSETLAAMRRISARLGLRRAVRVFHSTLAQVPVVVGYLRPVILLPVSLVSTIPVTQLEAILAHELAHVQRHDFVVNLLQTLVETLFFYHPAVWWLSHRVRVEREHCCDDLVVALLGNRVEYGRALVAIEQLRGRSAVLALGATDGSLLSRVRRILGARYDRAADDRSTAALVGIAMFCVTCALSMTWSLVAKDDVTKEHQPAIAKLPGNVTIELVGVTVHTSTNDPDPGWWTPGGSPLADGRIDRNPLRQDLAPADHRVFVVEVKGMPETSTVRVAVQSAGKATAFSTWGGTYRGKPEAGTFTSAGPFIDADRTSVRVSVATDDWGPIQKVSPLAKHMNEPQLRAEDIRCYKNIGPQRIREEQSNSHAMLTIAWPQNQDDLAEFEIWALDRDGKRYDVVGTAGPSGGREFEFPLALARVGRFEYRLRPYRHSVTFENVSLQSGKKTDVTVKMESSPEATDDPDEAGESQMLSWSMLVDGTLAETTAKLGRNELPRQGAFRVLECDAAKIRRALFDPAVKAHVYADAQAPGVLALSTYKNDWHNEVDFQTLRMQHQSGAVSFANGTVNGRYRSLPGQPFELELTEFSLDTDPYPANGMKQKIKRQPLTFRGDIPIGSAVAFVGKAEGTPGREEFHVVRVYESVPKLTDQARRLLADATWFKAGRSSAKSALRQAEVFNSRAAKFPVDLPERWTKKLFHGGSVSLVAIARPRTHPFCWWDADGQPRSTDWSLQQHAFGQVAMLALVCVRDPAAEDLQRQGVSYTFHGNDNFGPVPLYRPWGDLADSELYLFCVYNTDNEQRPTIGVYAGDGPWAELGKLKPREEITLGRADYLLGESPLKLKDSSNLIVGRRYLADEEVRLQVIDRQGKVWPARPNLSRSGISDTQDEPVQWQGWCDYNAQIPVDQIEQYVLESRPRQWNAFAGFASELDATRKDELPKLKPAQSVAFAPVVLTDQLTRKLDAWLQTKYGGIFREEDRQALVEDFRRFIDRHTPQTLAPEKAALISRGFDNAVSSVNGDYLDFFRDHKSLKWFLRVALNPRALSPAELARREQQRNDLRKIIREIPLTQFHVARTHGHAIAQLDKLFNDPWRGWFHEPLSDDELARFQQSRKNWVINDVITAHGHLDTIVRQAKTPSIEADYASFDTSPFPLDAEVIANSKSSLLRFHTRYADQTAFNGLSDLVFDEASPARRRVLDFSRTTVEVPDSTAPGLTAVQQWAAEKRIGLLAYESARHGLFMLRGAKLAVLPVSTWHDADRLSDAELFRIVADQSRDSILLADFYGPRPDSTGYGPALTGPLLAVETAAGELGVVRIESVSSHGITARLRPRPNAKRTAALTQPNVDQAERELNVDSRDAAEAIGQMVVGTVVTPEGKPISGIEVLAFEGGKQLDQRFTTDGRGQFRVLKAWRESDHYLTLVARDGRERLGWFDFFFHAHSDNGQKSDDGSFRMVLLPLNRTIRGQLLDQSGLPLSQVPVQVEYLQHEINFASVHWQYQKIDDKPLILGGVTDADGRYELKLPADSFAWIGDVHPDWVHQRIQVARDKDAVAATKLVRAAKVAGWVTRSGKPVAGVSIGAQAVTPDMQSGGWGETKTDAAGKYVIGGLAAGEFNILLLDGADKTLTAPAYPAADLKSGEIYQADFALSVGRRLAGRVVDAQSGEPVAHCTVGYYGPARPRAGAACLSAETNSRGEFEFFVPPGPCHVYIAENREPANESSRDDVVPADRDPEPVVLKTGPKPKEDGGLSGLKVFIGPPLERKVSMHFQRMPLADALDKICKSADVTLNLDGPGLVRVGYAKDMLVTIDADRVTLREALTQVLKPFEKLSFTVDENEIFVSNRQAVEAREKVLADSAPKQETESGVEKEDDLKKPGGPVIVLPDHLNVMAVGFVPGDEKLVSVATEKTVSIRCWDVRERTLVHEAQLDTDKHGNRFAMSGQLMLSADCKRVIEIMDGQVGIWDTETGKVVKMLRPPESQPGTARNLACTPDMALIACGQSSRDGFGSRDAAAIVWDVAAGTVLRTVKHVGAMQIQSVALSVDGKRLATGSQEAGTCVWELSTGKLLLTLPNANPNRMHPDPQVLPAGADQVLCLAFSPDGRLLAIGDMLGVKLVDAKTGELLHNLEKPFRFGRSGLVFSRDGQLLARVATDKVVPIWSTKTGKLLEELPTEAHGGTFSDDGRSFAVGFTDEKNGVAVWALPRQEIRPQSQKTVGAAGPSNSSWPSFRHDLAQTGVGSTQLPEKLVTQWEAKLGGPVSGTAAIVGGQIYVPCESGELICLDQSTGRRLWSYRSSRDANPKSQGPEFKASPTVTADAIYLGDEEGIFHAIDRATGVRRRTFETEGQIHSSAAVTAGKVLFGSYDKYVYCLNEGDGTLAWKFATEGNVHAAPTVIGGDALIAGCDGHLRIIEIGTGIQKADIALGSYLVTSPAVNGGVAYVGTFDNEVLAVNLTKKNVVWRYSSGHKESPFLSSPAVTDKLVLIGGQDKQVHAIDRANGRFVWKFATPAKVDSSPVVIGQRVFVGSEDGNLYELDIVDGKQRAKFNLGQPISASPAIGEGVLVIGSESNDGKVICLGGPPTASAPGATPPDAGKSQPESRPGSDAAPRNDGVDARPRPLEFRIAANPADGKLEPRVPADFEKRHYPDNSEAGRAAAKDKGFIWIRFADPKDGKVNLPLEGVRGADLRVALLADTSEHALLWDGKWSVEECRVVPEPQGGAFSVELKLNEAGGTALRVLTKSHLNQPLAIVVNGEIIAAPIIRSEIGRAVAITGNFTRAQAEALAAAIRGKEIENNAGAQRTKANSAVNGLSAAEVVKQIQAQGREMADGRLEASLKFEWLKPTKANPDNRVTSTGTVRWLKKGKQIRIELDRTIPDANPDSDGFWPERWTTGFDGEMFYTWNQESKTVVYGEMRRNADEFVPQFPFWGRIQAALDQRTPRASLFGDNPRINKASRDGREVWDISVDDPAAKSTLAYRGIAPDRGFLPSQIETHRNSRLESQLELKDFFEPRPGDWMAKTTVRTVTPVANKAKREGYHADRTETTITRLDVGDEAGLKNIDFELKLPRDVKAYRWEERGQRPLPPGIRTVLLRFLGGEKQEPLVGLQVRITNGYGDTQKNFGTFTTDETGTLKVSLPVAFYNLHLKSDKERPYLAVEEFWDKSSRRPYPDLSLKITGTKTFAEKWLSGEAREKGYEPAAKPDGAPRITYTLLPACELVLRAVDAETGKGLPGAEFYTENAAGEEWAHRIYADNLGSPFVESGGPPVAADAWLTDKDGNFKRLIGANAGYKYGILKAPVGYENVEGHEVDVDVVYGQRRAQRVFKFRRVAQQVPAAARPDDTTGTLTARFVYDGEPPVPQDLQPFLSKLEANSELPRGSDGRVFGVAIMYQNFLQQNIRPVTKDQTLLVGQDRGIANVVVWAESKNIPWTAPNDELPPATIQLKRGNYAPRISLLTVGQALLVENHDPLFFGFHADFVRNNSINQMLSARSVTNPTKWSFSKDENLPIHYRSDQGTWADGWILIRKNPFVAVSDEHGSFTIPGLPKGEWEFRAWHERKGFVQLPQWPQGAFKQAINPGKNDLGTVKLKPDVFGEKPVAPVSKELEPFQGTWPMDICDSENQTLYAPQKVANTWRWEITGNKITWIRSAGEVWNLTFSVDPAKSPKEIDLTYLDGPFKGQTCLGMYEWGGVNKNMLQMSVQDPGAKVARPSSISMKSDGQTSLIFLNPREAAVVPGPGAADDANSIPAAIRRLTPSIATVTKTNPVTGRPEPNPNARSGVIVDARGYILTMWHGDEPKHLRVRLADQSEFSAEVLMTDKKTKLAVLVIRPGRKLDAVSLADPPDLRQGDVVFAVPSPAQRKPSKGVVTAIGISPGDPLPPNLIESDMLLPLGEGGSLMVNEKGELVGIWIGRREGGKRAASYAIPLKDAQRLLTKALEMAAPESLPKPKDEPKKTKSDAAQEGGPDQQGRGDVVSSNLLDAMIEQPGLDALKQLLTAAGTKQPEPVELIVARTPLREADKIGGPVKVIGADHDQFTIVTARVRPVIGDDGVVENQLNKLPECAFVFDRQGRLIATLGGKIGTSRANSPSPDQIEILSLGPVEDWFVRVTRFENRDPFEFQSEYYRIANPVVNALLYFHYANSNPWSWGPEKIPRHGTLYFDFPTTSDKLGPGATGMTLDGVSVNPIIIWDGDRNRFVGAAAQRARGKPLYQVDTEWSRDFEPLVPKPDQLVVSGGARLEEHWHSWQTVVPDQFEAMITLTIPQPEGPPRIIRRTRGPGATFVTLHDTPDGDATAAKLELCDIAEKREVFDLPHPLGARPATHPPIVQVLNPGESARLLARPLANPPESLILEIKLQPQGTKPVP